MFCGVAAMALLPTAASAKASPLRRASIEDVRVEPIVKSAWNQMTADNSASGPLCYNYYTPHNWPCGCAATAGVSCSEASSARQSRAFTVS